MTLKDTAKKNWEPFEKVKAWADVAQAIQPSLELCDEDIECVIPSIQMRGEGPALTSLFFTTRTLLAEIHDPLSGLDVDFVARKSLRNIRYSLGKHDIKTADGKDISFLTATIAIRHGEMFGSSLSYAGTNRDSWMKLIKEAFPIAWLEKR